MLLIVYNIYCSSRDLTLVHLKNTRELNNYVAIDLNILQKANPRGTIEAPTPQKRIDEDFLYRDIHLDLKIGTMLSNSDSGIKNTRARAVYKGLAAQEPRINITKVSVVGYPEQESYQVVIAIQIPTLNNRTGLITGNLGADGFKFKN